MKQIFVGGVGRSGTTILLHALYKHHQIYAIPIETKFVVQVDGLSTLVDRLSREYSFTDAPVAITRFQKLMREVVTFEGLNPYDEYRGEPYGRQDYVPQEIFPNYHEAVDELFSKIENRYYPRHEIVPLARSLVDSLFDSKARDCGKHCWAEKTPSNISRIEFLFEMYPDAKFVNCVRDPRGVLHSLLRLHWIVPDIEKAAALLASYYEYMEAKRAFGHTLGERYLELRLESLVADPLRELSTLTEFLGLEPYAEPSRTYLLSKLRQGSIRWDEEKARYCDSWEREFSPEEIEVTSRLLGKAIRQYGYAAD